MPADPLQTSCSHTATIQERDRDPNYLFCNAAAGEACTWAKRYDGVVDPPFHSERIEAAVADQAVLAADQGELRSTLDTETFREAILDTGLV